MSQAQKQPSRIQKHNVNKILDAALSLFSRFGYRGTTVDQIATEAGMSKANLLYYYKHKEDIYQAVLGNILELWLEPLQTLKEDGDVYEELWHYTQQKLELARQHPEASRLFASEIIQGAPILQVFLATELRDRVQSKCAVLQQWIAENRLNPVEPIHLLFLIWAATQHYADFRAQIEQVLHDDEERIFAGAEQTLQTVLKGLIPH